MPELTSSPQNPVMVWPLYLPQIYWVLLRNFQKAEYSKYITDRDFMPKWEMDFTKALKDFGFIVEGPFWDEKFSSLIAPTGYPSKASLREFIEKLGGSSGMAKIFVHKKRSDRKTADACEAMGLISYRQTPDEIFDQKPSKFFDSLLAGGGRRAAFLLLGRLLSLRESTVEGLKSSPRTVLAKVRTVGDLRSHVRKDLIGIEHWHSIVRIFLNSVTKKMQFGDDKMQAKELYDLAIDQKWIASLPEPTIAISGSWRDDLPPNQIIEALEVYVAKKPKGPQGSCEPQIMIFQGPPGTGKTRTAVEIARILALKTEVPRNFVVDLVPKVEKDTLTNTSQNPNYRLRIIQFHPSYSYEDFIEGLRPVRSYESSQTIRYAIVPGPLKVMGQLARAYWEAQRGPVANPFSIPLQIFRRGSSFTIPKEFEAYTLPQRAGHLLDKSGTVLAATGSGAIAVTKDYASDDGYLDVEWKPLVEESADMPQFVLVIDELNRGNPAKIFGELLYLLERSKRLGAKSGESSPVLLPYSKEEFILPLNFHVLCTMNPADRSLAPLDQAFRRRFETVTLTPRLDLLKDSLVKFGDKGSGDAEVNKRVACHIEAINSTLQGVGISADRHIGHFYPIEALSAFYDGQFAQIEEAIKSLWNLHLYSLIRDILGADEELGKRFATEFKITYENLASKDGTSIFKIDHLKEGLLGGITRIAS